MCSQGNFAIAEQKVACSTKKQNNLKILEYGAHGHIQKPMAYNRAHRRTHTHISAPGLTRQREVHWTHVSVSEDTDKTR